MKEKGQIQIIAFLVILGLAAGLYFTGVLDFGKKDGKSTEQTEGQTAVEVTHPVLSNLSPSGELAGGTSQVILSVTTDRAAYCRYSTSPNQEFSSMSKRFSYNNDKTLHTVEVKGLTLGSYTYYVRCSALKGTKNTEDALIQFKIGSSSYSGGSQVQPGDAPPLRFNLSPSGSIATGITTATLSLNTNEAAYCRYSTSPNQEFSSMGGRFSYDSSKTIHTYELKGLSDNKLYEYYVRCKDMKGNENNEDVKISFGVGGVSTPSSPYAGDTNPPSRFDPYPDDEDLSADTRKVTISLKTDETAFCRYSNISGMSYDSMSAFTNTNATFHSTEVTGLSEGRSYEYYVRCADSLQNKNTNDFVISFNVEAPEDLTPPERFDLYPTGDTFIASTTEVTMSLRTSEPAYCKYDTDNSLAYNSMGRSFGYMTGMGTQYLIAKVTGLTAGQAYSYFVRCKDYEGNANTGGVKIYFSIGQ
jgi:hypothetical protein